MLAPFRPGVLDSTSAFDGPFARIAARMARFAEYRRTLAELRALTPRQLTDAGLHGRDLKTVARTSIYGN
ncbi:MAG: DUF1127 domain-containing protein [Amaricoccus sp.]|nr:DUF1127 domain-containing protein [Amaricoccus sp.]